MTQQAKKNPTAQSAKKPQDTETTQEKVYKMERDGVENLMRTADGFNHVAAECTDICSGNIGALIESGNAASRILQDMSTEILEGTNRKLAICAEISQEAFACRTINDMVELQNSAVQQLCDNYFTTSNKLCSILFDSWAKALAPLNERTTVASDQIRKAMAA